MIVRFLNQFRDISIRLKIIIGAQILTLVIMTPALFVFSSTELFASRQEIVRAKVSTVRVLSANITAAIVFDDKDTASELLQSLTIDPEFVSAILINSTEEILSEVTQSECTAAARLELSSNRQSEIYFNDFSHVTTVEPIFMDDTFIGTVAVHFHLNNLNRIISRLAFTVVLILLSSMVLAYFAASSLQRTLTNPLQRLLKMMEEVAETQDYSRRISGDLSRDEIGVVSQGFNNMLIRIEQRDQALLEARQEAEAASRAKTSFVANMTHEIRTPMNGVLGMLQILESDQTNLSDGQRKYLSVMHEAADNLTEVINDILDFSKIESGNMVIEHVEFNLIGLLKSLVETYRPLAANSGNTLQLVPGGIHNERVEGDATKLRQIMSNLVGNAIKFTRDGTIVLSCEEVSAHRYRFEVQDTGVGIEPAYQARIFDAFAQADDSITRKFGGTGLGLSISKQLVELMDGEIGLSSTLGEGSRFWFEIPLG